MNNEKMANEFDIDGVTSGEMMIALTEAFPESTYGAVPAKDHYDALEAFFAFDDGVLDEVPNALAAYVDHQQHTY